jgi:hypothetical protein
VNTLSCLHLFNIQWLLFNISVLPDAENGDPRHRPQIGEQGQTAENGFVDPRETNTPLMIVAGQSNWNLSTLEERTLVKQLRISSNDQTVHWKAEHKLKS